MDLAISVAWAGHKLTTAEHRGQRETTSTRSRSWIETSAPRRPSEGFCNRLLKVNVIVDPR
jgi:hypothetical protein